MSPPKSQRPHPTELASVGEKCAAPSWDIQSVSPSEAIVWDQDEVLGPHLWETFDMLSGALVALPY